MTALPPVPALEADGEAIRACAAALRAASAQVDDLGTFVAGAARITDWSGLGAASYRESVRPMGRRADAMSLALRALARRVEVHADEMDRLASARGDLVGVRDDLVRGQVAGPRVAAFALDLAAWLGAVDAEEAAMVAAFDRVLTLDQVEGRYAGRPDPADGALATRPPADASAERVNDWWDGLTRGQQLAVAVAAPGAIGNLDGIPARDRNAANTVAVDRDLADPTCPWPDNARAADEARLEITSRSDPMTGEPVLATVYLYDPGAFDGEGRIGIAAGDLTTADNVALVVPGLGTDATSAAHYADRAATLYEAARTLAPRETNATLSWIGYDAPELAQVVREDLAESGGGWLADTVDGVRASRDGQPAHLTAIGYSYGSTTLGHGAHDVGLAVDDIVLVGSPGVGAGADHADDLGIDPGHVWAGANSSDPIADLGNHGVFHPGVFGGLGLGDDPVEDDFGANRFRAESTSRGGIHPFSDHTKYFDHDTESLANITRIVNGDYAAVVQAEHLHDPWLGGPEDPEADRVPTAPKTRHGVPPPN